MPMLFERLNTPQEAMNFKLGAALKMERTVLEKILEDSVDAAQDDRLKQLLRHHMDETRQHIDRLEQVFGLFGWEVDDSPCPAIEAIHKEAKANAKITDDSIVDSIILSGSAETEHHEIAVYEWLIMHARALGRDDAAGLLQQNLEEEQHTLREATQLAEQLAPAFAHAHA
jgi:ferritin-like metal-binding protein YciE